MRRAALLALGCCALVGTVMVAAFAAALGAQPSGAFGPSVKATADIPAEYLALYIAAAERVGIDWSILAAIGKVETDHGRSTASGVRAGVNAFGCCAGPMQFSVVGSPSTWDTYGNGGSPYDPVDAIPAAARLLRASGAPQDYHAAVWAYNHAEWYVRRVLAQAQKYRDAEQTTTVGLPSSGDWLAAVPGTDARCDRRIVPDVVMILERYHAQAGDCYAASGHAPGGEHPLGLAIDLVPAADGSWILLDRLAHDLGWREACGGTGCAGELPSPMRFIGWTGYANHGPGLHLHLSWAHGAGFPASTVETLGG